MQGPIFETIKVEKSSFGDIHYVACYTNRGEFSGKILFDASRGCFVIMDKESLDVESLQVLQMAKIKIQHENNNYCKGRSC